MVNLCYSDPELAFSGGLEFLEQEEKTVYIVEVKYPSGVEYHLKKKIIPGAKCVHKIELNENHRFTKFENAMNAVSYFRQLGKKFCVKKYHEVENGYKFVKYYYLCSM